MISLTSTVPPRVGMTPYGMTNAAPQAVCLTSRTRIGFIRCVVEREYFISNRMSRKRTLTRNHLPSSIYRMTHLLSSSSLYHSDTTRIATPLDTRIGHLVGSRTIAEIWITGVGSTAGVRTWRRCTRSRTIIRITARACVPSIRYCAGIPVCTTGRIGSLSIIRRSTNACILFLLVGTIIGVPLIIYWARVPTRTIRRWILTLSVVRRRTRTGIIG